MPEETAVTVQEGVGGIAKAGSFTYAFDAEDGIDLGEDEDENEIIMLYKDRA